MLSDQKQEKQKDTHTVSDLNKNKPRIKSTYIFLSVKDQQWCHSDPIQSKTDADIVDTGINHVPGDWNLRLLHPSRNPLRSQQPENAVDKTDAQHAGRPCCKSFYTLNTFRHICIID